ncbi:MAG: UbiD family decarboxylase [Thermodesulfobacteriota bacterium]|nr:UbiD family decarboxylase [Thermodesulfobacteriota bacterium]
MAYKDLREWISKLEGEGELKRIKAEVDWDRELGTITRMVLNGKGPALLFENIKDYKSPPYNKFFTNSIGSYSRVSFALGMKEEIHPRILTRTMKDRFAKPLTSSEVNQGSVKENILTGSDIDLFKFPIPKWHHLDGGRYINTVGSVITRDPETGVMNAGTYRGMIAGKDKIAVLLATSQHWGIHFAKYKERKEPMPVAVVYGWDPSLFIAASTPIPHHGGVTEYEAAGALRESPVELVKCEKSDLLVPAHAEMVVEGFIADDPKTFAMEGPFGEYPGYYGGMAAPKPVINVNCITHRNDPIFQGTLVGSSPGRWDESAYFSSSFCAVAWNYLEAAGVPGVTDVWFSPVTASTNLRVRIKKLYRGHAKQVANALWGTALSNYCAKHVIVVDEDIDIHEDEAIDWAISYRVNATMGDIVTFPGTIGSMLDPSVPLEDRNVFNYGQGKWTRVLVDATKNWELGRQEQYGGEFFPPLATDVDPEIEKIAIKRWKEYGLE